MITFLRQFIRETLLEARLTGGVLKQNLNPNDHEEFSYFNAFRRRAISGEPFYTADKSTRFTIDTAWDGPNAHLWDAIQKRSYTDYNAAIRKGIVGWDVDRKSSIIINTSNHILRDEDFTKQRYAGEISQIEDIDNALIDAAKTFKTDIPVYIGDGRVVHVARIEHVSTTGVGAGEKTDAYLRDKDGNIVAKISLKSADDPTGMHQWGGFKHLETHPEIVKYLNDVRSNLSVIPCYREISHDFMEDALYGKNKEIDLVIVSKKTGLKWTGRHYEFIGKVFYRPMIPDNLENPRDDWMPVLHTYVPHGKPVRNYNIPGRSGFFPRALAKKRGSTQI